MPTFHTPGPIAVAVDIGAGHVRLNASDRDDTVVTVSPTDEHEDACVRAAEQVAVDYADGHLSVRGPKARLPLKLGRSVFGRTASVDVVVDLPSDSRVEARVWADIRSEGRLGESTFDTAVGAVRLGATGRLKVRTAAGDVSVARSSGHADVRTSSGKIRIGAVDGTALAKTSNGDITIGEVSGDARLSTANGDITIERALATVGAKTAYGSVRIGEVVRGSVVVDSGFGELDLGVRAGTAAWLDVRSGSGGVRSHLDAAETPGSSDETVELRARTGWGDIVIRRAAPVS